jgi:cation-transporting ATPase E
MATIAAAQPQQGERPRGLSEVEATARRERGEGNQVEPETSRSYARILLENLLTPIHLLLFVIAVVLAILGLYGDAILTGGLIVINIVVTVIQEARAKRQLDRIALLTRPMANVLRDGEERTIEPGEIVLGDAIVARPGDQILVDGIIIQDSAMSVDESLLTGESELIPKRVGDRVYSGSFCMTGGAVYEADSVGENSVAAKITSQARTYRNIKTPLQREVGIILKVMLLLAIALAVLVGNSFWKLYNELPLKESVQAAAVIAALIPQGLVLMVTVTYAMAAMRMSGKGALIQRMNAVESTSHIAVLCMDKTGTLTTNRLTLQGVEPIESNDADVRRLLGEYAVSTPAANQTIDALIAGLGGTNQARQLREEVPFSSALKWSALAYADQQSPDWGGAYFMGAPDILAQALRPGASLGAQADEWKAAGLRVLLFAWHPDVASLHGPDGEPQLPQGLIPVGAICISDELRPEAKQTIANFAETGVTLKVISGDHPETVTALAIQAGFPADCRMISGLELDALDDTRLGIVARDTTIFGRITPQQKERLIGAIRAQGHYVAMIGDGVNDVLALKQANLAVAMRSGSQVTRNVADIVLVDDSFAALPHAFREGQRILRGMHDIIDLFLVRAAYVSLIILATSLLGEAFPVTPKQNALLATLTVGIPAFALAAWATPGRTAKSLISSSSHFVVPAALSISFVCMTVYLFFRAMSNDLELARSALTTTSVMCGLLLVPFVEPPARPWTGGDTLSGDWRPTILAFLLMALYMFVVIVGPLRHFYDLTILPYSGYVLLGFVVAGWAVGLRFIWRLRIGSRVQVWRRKRRARKNREEVAEGLTTESAN